MPSKPKPGKIVESTDAIYWGFSKKLFYQEYVPRDRNSGRAKDFFRIRAARKMGREQKSGRRGAGEGKEGTLARKPLDFEKRPLVFTVVFIY